MADSSNSTHAPSASNIVIHPREQLRQLRTQMAQAVEMLISAIDAIDGDPDLEPNLAPVPSTSLGRIYPERLLKADSAFDELELDTSDLERSLGSSSYYNQEYWAQGEDGDYEEECQDECFDSDTEMNGDETDYSQGAMDEFSNSYNANIGSDGSLIIQGVGLDGDRLTNPSIPHARARA